MLWTERRSELTLQELKEITEIPEQRIKVPTAKNLRETGRAVAEKQLENNTWITVYQNGYALYHACGHSTVFPIHTCGAYLYVSSGISSYLPEQFFEKEPWYVRLVLEGEDRLDRNQREKEKERTVSYHAISEEWEIMGNARENPLEYLVDRENRKEIMHCLTERQKAVVSLCFFQQKSRKEAAKELGITSPAISTILSQAAQRLRKKYHSPNHAEREAAAV
ncbi:MAG: sigma-70 family RNA polymerase sigma factor [Lachnospiraceae bacterium]|nr:sigma-70 family RNA polymerase sigma factor [Lachnospiraceae bacterium]